MNRPPYFKGNDYPFWKTRMRIFLMAQDIDLWDIVENGPHIPTKLVRKPK